ncbi:TPA: 5'-nucleotidase [Burkholderia vietnamiensis]|uniref:5'-nucleotidase n=1 Tax=Burkholderia vietnamiensis TaxID=60552 RepID=UPI00158CFDBD|nr:5'-nucleotidase [Burkholderia vietnamiensis]MBR8165306.1 5'-nucleotidase [Burkholderia vietnamiensis]MCA8146106.1 5'-nucleotidase [Burkholderia vietnamiensis]HDR8948764.1 5'-nucleotidase [Burkholderia vietnamiensis]HDR9179301.1 5'-nucleotidase [Burkholderia vietnamiensis]HDR9210923.1 5'-nucleotidase [Burkholderia vietnamiensis]
MTSTTKITIAVSARALFDFEAENLLFREDDPSAYCALQATRLDVPASPGVAFPLVRKLLGFNSDESTDVEVVILSRNDPVTGLRVFTSARHHGLTISRAIFTSGAKPHRYLAPLEAQLFLSAHAPDVREAMAAGFAGARVYPASGLPVPGDETELRIAFDGDSVLFSDEAERVFRQQQLHEFNAHEVRNAHLPLPPGPLKPFFAAICALRSTCRSRIPVRTALVTARSAPAHERAIRTLMAWGVAVDEAMFLGGKEKTAFLAEFRPDIFFDDHRRNCEAASQIVATGHVPYGINNECRQVLH